MVKNAFDNSNNYCDHVSVFNSFYWCGATSPIQVSTLFIHIWHAILRSQHNVRRFSLNLQHFCSNQLRNIKISIRWNRLQKFLNMLFHGFLCCFLHDIWSRGDILWSRFTKTTSAMIRISIVHALFNEWNVTHKKALQRSNKGLLHSNHSRDWSLSW